MGPVVLDSARLNLRAWTPSDVPAMVALFDDSHVGRFITGGQPISAEEAARFIDRYARIQRERGWCRWALELKTKPDELAGFCGVGCTFAPEIELGWTLRRDLWGYGYATEAALAAQRYCFERVGFERIISVIDPGNAASIRVAERIGMRADGTVEHKGAELLRFVIDNPVPEAPTVHGFVRNCDGEPKGSSLDET